MNSSTSDPRHFTWSGEWKSSVDEENYLAINMWEILWQFSRAFSPDYKTHFFSSPTLLSLWKPSNKLVIPIIVTHRQKKRKRGRQRMRERERDIISWIEIRAPLSRSNKSFKATLTLWKAKQEMQSHLLVGVTVSNKPPANSLLSECLLPERVDPTETFADKESSLQCWWLQVAYPLGQLKSGHWAIVLQLIYGHHQWYMF